MHLVSMCVNKRLQSDMLMFVVIKHILLLKFLCEFERDSEIAGMKCKEID